MTTKEMIDAIKSALKFEDTPTPAATTETTSTAEVALTAYKLADGSEVMISALEVGGDVMIAEAPAPAGTYVLEDESSIVVGEDGKIAEIIAKADEAIATELPEDLSQVTPEQLRAASEGFATGTPEERIAKLETIAKALMEYCFGWQIRESQIKAVNDEAIAVYKSGFEAAEKKIEEQRELITKMLELVENIAELPSAEVPTPKKKTSFSKVETGSEKLNKYAEAAKKMAETNKN